MHIFTSCWTCSNMIADPTKHINTPPPHLTLSLSALQAVPERLWRSRNAAQKMAAPISYIPTVPDSLCTGRRRRHPPVRVSNVTSDSAVVP